ncbi:hypothetical protein ABEX88_08205 [Priestia megaterium]
MKVMLHPLTLTQQLDNFYKYLMSNGYKMHEIDQADIHHLFRLVRQMLKEQKEEKPKEEEPEKVYIDQIPGW